MLYSTVRLLLTRNCTMDVTLDADQTNATTTVIITYDLP